MVWLRDLSEVGTYRRMELRTHVLGHRTDLSSGSKFLASYCRRAVMDEWNDRCSSVGGSTTVQRYDRARIESIYAVLVPLFRKCMPYIYPNWPGNASHAKTERNIQTSSSNEGLPPPSRTHRFTENCVTLPAETPQSTT